ncbi:hypothetical protein IM41_05155 [Fervidobacterium sp. SC_NGM5_G05]|nr:hypothetical protein IM41_05155 [Fervidobacterium sp. SC_NGM5_G05]
MQSSTRILRKIHFFLLIVMLIQTFTFGVNIEKVYVGIKYSFRNFRTDGTVILVDPFSRNMVVYNLELKQIVTAYSSIGSHVMNVYQSENDYIIVDRTSPKISKITLYGNLIKSVSFQKRIQSSLLQDNVLYILLEGGELYSFDKDLNTIGTYKFSGSPAYIFSWNGKIFATYLWNENYDIEFVNEKPQKIGLTTPSILVGDILIDTRDGQLYNLKTGKITKISKYISSAYYDGEKYYITSMAGLSLTIVQNDSVQNSFKVPYTPTFVKKVGEYIVILSAPYNKVMVTKDGKEINVFDTGDYPFEVFTLKDSQSAFSVYCSDSGEFYYYTF